MKFWKLKRFNSREFNVADTVSEHMDLLINFINESKENLEIIESTLLAMEESNDPDLVNDVFRSIHSIKGAVSFFNKKNIESIAHTEETILSIIRDGRASITSEIISALLEANDKLKLLFRDDNLGDGQDICDIMEKLKAILARIEVTDQSANQAIETPTDLNPSDIKKAKEKQSSGCFLYAIQLAHQSVKNIDIGKCLLEKIESIGKIIHQSNPIDDLSANIPNIELYFESIVEPDIFIPYITIPEIKISHIEEAHDKKKIQEKNNLKNEKCSIKTQCEFSPPVTLMSKEDSDIQTQSESISKMFLQTGDKKNTASLTNMEMNRTIRIGVNVLDELLELIGEVVLGRNQFLTKYANDGSFKTLSQSITKLHQHVIQTRMQPINTLFEKYKRTVRDLSSKLNKKIELTIEGGELELDRTILEGLTDPLTHLVRNSIDHGVETPEERSRLGKGVVGNVSLRAIHESGQILIEIEDDGRGLDKDRILVKAIEKGLVTPDESTKLEDKDIYAFIFNAGFSTKDSPTEISGRGVGMDVVRTNLEKLGCNVELTSRKQKGTLISISIPLTQAIVNSSVISGLIISIGEYSLAIPQLAVNEIIKLQPGDQVDKIEMIKGREVFKLRDKIIPLVHLEDVLGIKRTCFNPRENRVIVDRRRRIYSPEANPAADRRKKSIIFIVLNFKHDYFGILVDRIEGTEEIVVKRMPKIIKNRKVFAGATILGNGKVSLIFDINGIVEKSGLNFNQKRDAHFDLIHLKKQREDIHKIVIFNNADEEYFAIPVNLLSEVDRFTGNEICRVGDREFIKRHGESIPLMRLEKCLKVSPISTDKETNVIFVPARLKYPTGIVGNSIITSIDLTEEINTKEADEKGIMGTFFYNNMLVNLIDIYTLIQNSDPEKYKAEIDEGIENCHILFADDQLFFRQLVTQYFKSYNIKQVTVARNGQEALQILYNNPRKFDVIVSDIEMPIINGYQLVSSIKADPSFNNIPVMALTTLDGEQNIRKGYEAGFDAYEVKLDKDKVIKGLSKLYRSKKKSMNSL